LQVTGIEKVESKWMQRRNESKETIVY